MHRVGKQACPVSHILQQPCQAGQLADCADRAFLLRTFAKPVWTSALSVVAILALATVVVGWSPAPNLYTAAP